MSYRHFMIPCLDSAFMWLLFITQILQSVVSPFYDSLFRLSFHVIVVHHTDLTICRIAILWFPVLTQLSCDCCSSHRSYNLSYRHFMILCFDSAFMWLLFITQILQSVVSPFYDSLFWLSFHVIVVHYTLHISHTSVDILILSLL